MFLLNRVLTIDNGVSNSHKNLGWERFTLKVIKKINQDLNNVFFILCGKDAISIKEYIDTQKHKISISSHPSPFSCRKMITSIPNCGAFLDTPHFKKCNLYLNSKNREPIIW